MLGRTDGEPFLVLLGPSSACNRPRGHLPIWISELIPERYIGCDTFRDAGFRVARAMRVVRMGWRARGLLGA